MSVQDLWALALAHHVPYFVVGMLLMWQWPNLLTLWAKLREAWLLRRMKRDVMARAHQRAGAPADSSAELRAKLQVLHTQQEGVTRRLAALQRQGELGDQQKEHV